MGICAVKSMLHTADCQPRCQRNRGDSKIRINTSGSRVSDQTGTGLDLHKTIRNSKVSQGNIPLNSHSVVPTRKLLHLLNHELIRTHRNTTLCFLRPRFCNFLYSFLKNANRFSRYLGKNLRQLSGIG